MKTTTKYVIAGLIVFMGLLGFPLLVDSLYVVEEGHRGILLRLGAVVTIDEAGIPPGLHVKFPVTDDVKHINTQVRTFDFSALSEGFQGLPITVKWQVAHPIRYYTATSGEKARAQKFLEDRILDRLRMTPEIDLIELNRVFVSQFGIKVVECVVDS